ncbi:membrane hypothetical protein [Xenorhabdus nematophila str. Anatoliense]|nr:membrane hypothetical protein [Xenorhabdus nematophila str. Anatoliense]
MNKPWLLVAWLLAIEILAILLLIPGDWTDRAIKRESVLVEQSLGIEARDWIQNKASTWFRSSIIDSGFFDYASPVLHRYSVRGTMYLMAGLFIVFFVPIALDPVVIPLTMMTCCVLVGLTFGNLQKRV